MSTLANATVKQVLSAVQTNPALRAEALKRCDDVLARSTTSDNKRQRWMRVKQALTNGQSLTVSAAFGQQQPKADKSTVVAPDTQPSTDEIAALRALVQGQQQMVMAFLTALPKSARSRFEKAMTSPNA
jgi:hypothetical protein